MSFLLHAFFGLLILTTTASASLINFPAASGDTVMDCVETSKASPTERREFWLYYTNDKLVNMEGGLGSYWPAAVPTSSSGKGPDFTFAVDSALTASGKYVFHFGFNASQLLGPEGSEHRYGYGEIFFDPANPAKTRVTGAEYSRHGFLHLKKDKIATFAGNFACEVVHPSEAVQKCVAREGYDSLGSMFINECQKLWEQESYRQSHLHTIQSYFNY
jgi:hypothetical protein